MYTYLNCENSICSLGQAVESSAESFADIERYAQSRLSRTAAKSCCNASGTESSHGSQSGTTSAPLTALLGEAALTWLLAAFRVRTSVSPEKEQESTESVADSGEKWSGWFAKLDRATSSWRTRQCSLLADLDVFSETWPKWGMMRGGVCWELTPVDFRIIEPECGWLPTPSGVNGGRNNTMGRVDEWGGSSNPLRGTPIGKALSPNFEEIVMGWPIEWTAQTPYETARFQQWRASHGEFSQTHTELL